MKPTLTLTKKVYESVEFIGDSSVPSLGEMINVQNKEKQENHLSEDEGLFIGYGKIAGCFPYKEKNQYTTHLRGKEVNVAVLENKYLKATFLTEFGGRLWELFDKKEGRNLLYTNDVIQPRNLAIRNAWFSGGVEWNIGSIGHSSFTCEPMNVAETVREDGIPILRLYEFERNRQVTYQMDFWLEEDSDILFCRMRIDNRNDEMIPMYWWSNIAVPEFDHGRIVVPATSSYKNSINPSIRKVAIPIDNEINQDITYYNDIDAPVDYFFDIEENKRKYITNLDETGYGLLQFSSDKLRGRKLFSWGHLQGSDNWQDILTKEAGKYIEIQAGLAKTQYECVPMPPHTAWEWVECYTSLKLPPEQVFNNYSDAVLAVDCVIEELWGKYNLNDLVTKTKHTIGKKKFDLKSNASGFGGLENLRREKQGEPLISEYLEFTRQDDNIKDWITLLEEGNFDNKDVNKVPQSFMLGEEWLKILEKSSENEGIDNWYVWYHLGIMYKYYKDYKKALICFEQSIILDITPWAYHALAYLYIDMNAIKKAVKYATKAIQLKSNDYSLCESCLKILLNNEYYGAIIECYAMLDKSLKKVGRIKMYLAFAYAHTGDVDQASEIMDSDGGLMVDDIREGEVSITELWILLFKKKNPAVKEEDIIIPKKYDFRMH
ncbi:DUF5107 domain-containing protein [Vallitalea okinawensis]|uniref:DUF5107 domain-containing protein n=1 Tax=Vallitalea okinawensis TaxID=2078660 RepID=UPI000CFB173C|nr:DUF5107 domain-containing protein [Vallitalea okinawensis]